jgi:hypothetical protein
MDYSSNNNTSPATTSTGRWISIPARMPDGTVGTVTMYQHGDGSLSSANVAPSVDGPIQPTPAAATTRVYLTCSKERRQEVKDLGYVYNLIIYFI